MESEITQQKDTIRIETFSDGVFCIALTLLSIEIGVELHGVVSNESLQHALFEKWPIYVAYVISFINVLLAWMGHHSLFKNFKTVNSSLMVANGLLLMLVALVPFPTKTLGLFMTTDALKTAVIFYTAYFVLISIAFKVLWSVGSRNKKLLMPGVSSVEIKNTTRNENIGLICNSIIFLIAFVSPEAAMLLSFAMWIYWIWFS